MTKNRLEAFSDGVIAILITIMVLELKTPIGTELSALLAIAPVLFCYVLSFVLLGIYWNNHHHLLQAIEHVNGGILWANLHLLFWLSLVPFVTVWMGENSFAAWPVALYGVVTLFCAIAFFILVRTLIAAHGPNSIIAIAMGNNFKGKISPVLYAAAIPLAFVATWISFAIYILVPIIWLVPDRRIEKTMAS
jgi:uncharacterized membrane protein